MVRRIRSIFARKFDDAYYNSALNVAASICNFETFGPLKACRSGEEIAICGAGPTLAQYSPIEGVKHIALNRALLYDKVHFDYFIADDWDGVKFFKDILRDYECEKFFGHQLGCEYIRQIPESFRIDAGAKRYYTDSYMLGGNKSRFVCDIDKMAIGNFTNIALSAFQIALFMRPKTIYLVGCDASSSGHFVESASSTDEEKERVLSDLNKAVAIDSTIMKWRELKDFAQAFYPDIDIVSVNPVGLKGLFRDIYQL